ncbi:MAG: TIGR03619 family F420-dependent LLM class oxidoreductase [Gaiellaceae bacterium]
MWYGVHARLGAHSDPGLLARHVEDLGFEALFFPEHTHIPRDLDESGEDTAVLRRQAGLLDPFIALAFAATTTRQLRLGTGVCLIALRDPILLAKEVATLDQLCGGRLLFGVGVGSRPEEAVGHGLAPADRFDAALDVLDATIRIWMSDVASFQGRFASFSDLRQGPKPLQKPHPPVLAGGSSRRVVEEFVRARRCEWFPHHTPELLENLQRQDDAGVSVFAPPKDHAVLSAYAQSGVRRCVFTLNADDAGVLDELAALREFLDGRPGGGAHSHFAHRL